MQNKTDFEPGNLKCASSYSREVNLKTCTRGNKSRDLQEAQFFQQVLGHSNKRVSKSEKFGRKHEQMTCFRPNSRYLTTRLLELFRFHTTPSPTGGSPQATGK